MPPHIFLVSKTLFLPTTPTSVLERVQGKARPQVKMTSVNVCTRARLPSGTLRA